MIKNNFLLFTFFAFAFVFHAFSEPLSLSEIKRASTNWLEINESLWKESFADLQIDQVLQISSDEEQALPLYLLTLEPEGYLVLSADNNLPVIQAFSFQGRFDEKLFLQKSPFLALLRRQGKLYLELLTSQENTRSLSDFQQRNRKAWQKLLNANTRAAAIEPAEIIHQAIVTEPWSQDGPFNLFLPRSDDEMTALAGCEPVAAALLMRHHKWPPAGIGQKEWYSDGRSLGFNIIGRLNADFSLPYNWDILEDSYEEFSPLSSTSELTVARLLFDLGTAFESFFDFDETGTYDNKIVPAMQTYFSFAGLNQVKNKSSSVLFAAIKADIDKGLPVHVSIPGHSFIASGRAEYFGKNYYYLNYGWGGYQSGWYRLNDGESGSVIDAAICNFLPAKRAIFKEMAYVQNQDFTLKWEFPEVHTAEEFKLSAKRGSRTTTINNSFSGYSRSYELTGQVAGKVKYILQAKVEGNWEAAAEIDLQISNSPAPVPEFTVDSDICILQDDGTFRLQVELHSENDQFTIETSRPDLFPSENIRIERNGKNCKVTLLPEDNISSNGILRLKAENAAGQKITKPIPFIWTYQQWENDLTNAENIADAENKKVFVIIGSNTNSFTQELRDQLCQKADIRSALTENYVLCYLQDGDVPPKLTAGIGPYYLPITVILKKNEAEEWVVDKRHNPNFGGYFTANSLKNFIFAGSLYLSTYKQTFNSDEQKVFLRVLGNSSWTISSSNPGILQPSSASGTGRATVEFTLNENDTTNSRETWVTVTQGGTIKQCLIIQQKAPSLLTVEFTVTDKIYDAEISAELNPTNFQLSGADIEHDVELDLSNAYLEFSDSECGENKDVFLYNALLQGEDANLYFLPAEIAGKGTITPLEVTISFQVEDKVYDQNNTATIGEFSFENAPLPGNPNLQIMVSNAQYSSKNVGNRQVIVQEWSIEGEKKDNFIFTFADNVYGEIFPKEVELSFSADTKVYDGTTTAEVDEFNFSPELFIGDEFSINYSAANFVDSNSSLNKIVELSDITYSGDDAANYSVTFLEGKGNILPKILSVKPEVQDREFDGTDVATINDFQVTEPLFATVLNISSVEAKFNSIEPGTRQVEVLNYQIDNKNYILEFQELTAEILPNSFSISPGWTAITWLLELNQASENPWEDSLLVYGLNNKVWTKVENPQYGTAYFVFNKEPNELVLYGKNYNAENNFPEDANQRWALQAITSETEPPENSETIWLFENKRFVPNEESLIPGKAYWIYK